MRWTLLGWLLQIQIVFHTQRNPHTTLHTIHAHALPLAWQSLQGLSDIHQAKQSLPFVPFE
jgi:hypothetical protein